MRKGGRVVSKSERTPSEEVIAKFTPRVHADVVGTYCTIQCSPQAVQPRPRPLGLLAWVSKRYSLPKMRLQVYKDPRLSYMTSMQKRLSVPAMHPAPPKSLEAISRSSRSMADKVPSKSQGSPKTRSIQR